MGGEFVDVFVCDVTKGDEAGERVDVVRTGKVEGELRGSLFDLACDCGGGNVNMSGYLSNGSVISDLFDPSLKFFHNSTVSYLNHHVHF